MTPKSETPSQLFRNLSDEISGGGRHQPPGRRGRSGFPLHQMPFRLNGSLLNVLDAITVSYSTEVPYSRIRRQNNNRYYVYCNYAIKSYFCCHWRNIMSNCATGSSNVTKILRLVRTRTIAPMGKGGGNHNASSNYTAIADVCNG